MNVPNRPQLKLRHPKRQAANAADNLESGIFKVNFTISSSAPSSNLKNEDEDEDENEKESFTPL